jgi:type IV pilus assembly protein PilW
MGIGLVVLAAVTTTFMAQTKFYNAQEQINEMQQNARGAMDVISRELKMAGYKPNGGTFAGVTYSASQLRIQADLVGNDGLTTGTDEDVIYTYDSTNDQILRNGQTLADNVTAFDFSYLDATGTTTTTTANIRQVSISITAQTAKPDPNYTTNSGYRTYTVAATITPPNLAL